MITDFEPKEIFFIEVQRIFHTFFAKLGYTLDNYHYRDRNNDRENDYFTFTNKELNQSVEFDFNPFAIVITYGVSFQFRIEKRRKGFNIVRKSQTCPRKQGGFGSIPVTGFEKYDHLS